MGNARIMMLSAVLALGACSDEEKKKEETDNTCDPQDVAACDEGLLCEQLGADRHECLPPVIVSGRVFDAIDTQGIGGATVVGLDANGAARTRVSRTNPDGTYELPVSVRRTEDGKPTDEAITLRVAAADHQPFATAPRSALPIELGKAIPDDQQDGGVAGKGDEDQEIPPYRIANAATDVALVPLAAADRGGATVTGSIAADVPGGVLVLAVSGDKARTSAVSDQDGAFVLFNVPLGATQIEGYRSGLALEPETVSVPRDGLKDVLLSASKAKLSTVNGSVSIVNASGGLTTSVILAVASTFDAQAIRGEAPAGLRAQGIGGAFSIKDVPPGRYAVLAAFENDSLVRDPDEGISGTDVVFVDVGAAGAAVSLDQGFKVTAALGVVSPGASGVELVAAGNLPLRWQDDSSEDGYELRVYDALGELVHENLTIARVTGAEEVSYTLDASSYKPGMLYQFRVWSFRDKVGRGYISASEDLRGVFEIKR